MTRHGRARAEADGQPSATASRRLAGTVHGAVADFQVRLREALLRSDIFLEAGYPEEATRILDEQRLALSDLRDRVDDALSAAAVERDAEQILAASPGFATLVEDLAHRHPAADDHDWLPGEAVRDQPGAAAPAGHGSHASAGALQRFVRRAPALASSAALGIAALAFLVITATSPRPQLLASADVDGDAAGDGQDESRNLAANGEGMALDLPWHLAQQRRLLAQLGQVGRTDPGVAAGDLDRLLDELLTIASLRIPGIDLGRFPLDELDVAGGDPDSGQDVSSPLVETDDALQGRDGATPDGTDQQVTGPLGPVVSDDRSEGRQARCDDGGNGAPAGGDGTTTDESDPTTSSSCAGNDSPEQSGSTGGSSGEGTASGEHETKTAADWESLAGH